MKHLWIFFFVIITGCSKPFQTTSNGSNNGLDCKVSKPNLQPPMNVFSHSKVDAQAFREETSIAFASEDLIFAKNSNLILTVNNECLRERSSGEVNPSQYLLTKNLVAKNKHLEMSQEDSYKIYLPKALKLSQLEKIADADDCLVGVSKNVIATVSAAPNDPGYGDQTHLAVIKHPASYDYYFGAAGITRDTVIAVIDNGVDITHEDLKDNLWINTAEKNGIAGIDDDHNGLIDDINGYDFASNTGNPNHKYPSDDNPGHTHGTHVSGLAAAVTNNSKGVAGVMSQHAKIMALNVFGNSDGAETDNIDAAIRYAADMGANVINMSLGGPGQASSTQQALQYAVSKGAIVVVAAGNDSKVLSGSGSNFYTPASYGASIQGMITIGATNANPSSAGALCSFSNRSPTYVELGTPGCDTSRNDMGILSTYKNNQYGYMAGTSMASPVAAGAVATVFSLVRDHYNKVLSPAEVETLMETGSRNFAGLNSYILNGKNLDLATLKDKIESTYGIAPPDDNGCR
jgi:subtilisin family serine protease